MLLMCLLACLPVPLSFKKTLILFNQTKYVLSPCRNESVVIQLSTSSMAVARMHEKNGEM